VLVGDAALENSEILIDTVHMTAEQVADVVLDRLRVGGAIEL
jgi:hypothetical protein